MDLKEILDQGRSRGISLRVSVTNPEVKKYILKGSVIMRRRRKVNLAQIDQI
jgi:hypothetical protein